MKLAPSVEKPRPAVRPGVVIALVATMGLCIAIPFAVRPSTEDLVAPVPDAFAELRAHCTPLDANLYIARATLSVVERATCLALAGKIDSARSVLHAMTAAERTTAISTIFTLAHPIADAGDDRSAGPMMALVVEIWPQNYMAMFHAGMAQYALGHDVMANNYLRRFLAMYAPRDVWRQRAVDALAGIGAHVPLATREAHFAE